MTLSLQILVKNDLAPGSSYAALSRVKDINRLYLKPFSVERFLKIGKSEKEKELYEEIKRLESMKKNK